MAGAEGLEPSSPVLETGILPLKYAPKAKIILAKKLFSFFMQSMFFASFAIFLQLQTILNNFFIAGSLIITLLTFRAF